MKTKSNFSVFLLATWCVSFITTSGIGQTCIKVECGCRFKNDSGTFEISMKDISKENRQATFTGVQDTDSNWSYDINPCYGFFESTQCQGVAMCKISMDRLKQVPVAEPNISSYSDYEEGKPLEVTYQKYKWKIDGILRQLVINLNFDEVKGASKVYQSETSNLQRYSIVHGFVLYFVPACPSLKPNTCNTISNGCTYSGVGVDHCPFRFFVVIAIYLVSGILFMKYKKGATGKEVIPNIAFWSSLPGLIKDGCLFSGKTVRNSCHCQRNEYDSIL